MPTEEPPCFRSRFGGWRIDPATSGGLGNAGFASAPLVTLTMTPERLRMKIWPPWRLFAANVELQRSQIMSVCLWDGSVVRAAGVYFRTDRRDYVYLTFAPEPVLRAAAAMRYPVS